jgi:hypothetical protein
MSKEEVHSIVGECEEIHSWRSHYEGSDDYTNDGCSILAIVDRNGRRFDPVWSDSWTELTPGVTTRYAGSKQRVRIYAAACPVSVLFRDWSEYVSYSDAEYCSSSSSERLAIYVSGSSNNSLRRSDLRTLLSRFLAAIANPLGYRSRAKL